MIKRIFAASTVDSYGLCKLGTIIMARHVSVCMWQLYAICDLVLISFRQILIFLWVFVLFFFAFLLCKPKVKWSGFQEEKY